MRTYVTPSGNFAGLKYVPVLLLILFTHLQSFSQNIHTIAGTGISNSSGDGGLAIEANLFWPDGVAVDASGNVYIAEIFGYRIRKISPSGIITTIGGTGVPGFSGDGGLAVHAKMRPRSIAVDHAGNLFIADQANYRIRMINTSGIISTVAGNGNSNFSGDGGPALQASLNSPKDIAVDGAGNLYIAEQGNSRVRKVQPNGIITTFAGNGMYGYSGDGGPAVQAKLSTAIAVSVDDHGNLFIADIDNHCVRKVTASGIITTIAGNGFPGFDGDGGPAQQAVFNQPRSVATDAAGNIYIADQGNFRIRRIDSTGIISTIAGDGSEGFGGDGGPAVNAQLENSLSIDLDAAGNIFICDQNNYRIRKVDVSDDHTAPVVTSSVTVSDVNCNGAGFSWTTNEPSSSFVSVSFDGVYFYTANDPQLATQHHIEVTGLNPNKTYHFYIRSCDASGNCTTFSPGTSFFAPPIPGAAGVISGNASVVSGANQVLYSIQPVPFATDYNWTVPAGASFTRAADGLSIRVNWDSACSGFIRVAPFNNCGAGARASLPVSVREFVKPELNGPAQVVLCKTPSDFYTIEPVTATDNCGIHSVSYTILGATHRTGTGTDASGYFAPGNSIIIWRAIDHSGNSSNRISFIQVRLPVQVSIPDAYVLEEGVQANTVYRGYTPASAIHLKAKIPGSNSGYTYQWNTGSNSFSLLVSPATPTEYSVTVTNNFGCPSSFASRLVNVEEVSCSNDKVLVCRSHGNSNSSICISPNAVSQQLRNGAMLGSCPGNQNSTDVQSSGRSTEEHSVSEALSLQLKAWPNPAAEFNLVISTSKNEKCTLTIYNALGGIMEVRTVTQGIVFQVGKNYQPGIYLAEVRQGTETKTLKLVKQ